MYDGFISYSHAADDLLAPRLQAGLQRFAKPWWKRRAVRIFRDESSLSANPHLWSSITEALDTSGWFVLLLSPDAAQSEWVNQEIAYWVENRDPKKVLPVVTDGEFGWADGGVFGDAVPDALRGVFSEEPRWVDLRFAHTEEQLDLKNPRFSAAIADVASAIRGVPKDELESEEVRQHRTTVRTAWSAGLLVAVLAIAAVGFGFQATQNAEEADLNAREAERLAQAESEARREADELADSESVARADAERQRTEALRSAALAKSRELAAAAIDVVDVDPELAALLAIQALDTVPDDAGVTPALTNALWRVAQRDRLIASIDLSPAQSAWVDASADGTRIAVSMGTTGMVRMYDETLTLLWEHHEETTDDYSMISVSADGSLVAASVVDSTAVVASSGVSAVKGDDLPNRVVVLDGATGAELRRLEFPDCTGVEGNALSADGRYLAIGSGYLPCERNGESFWVELYDTSSWEAVAFVPTASLEVGGVPEFDEDGRFFIFGEGATLVASIERPNDLTELSTGGFGDISSDGAQVVSTGGFDLVLYDVAEDRTLDMLGRTSEPIGRPIGVAVSDDGSIAVAGTIGRFTSVFDVESGTRLFRLPSGATTSAAIDTGRDRLYTANFRTLQVWDLSEGAVGITSVGDLGSATWVNGNSFKIGPEYGFFQPIDFAVGWSSRFFERTSGRLLETLDGIFSAVALEDGRFAVNTTDEQWAFYEVGVGLSEPFLGCDIGEDGLCVGTGDAPRHYWVVYSVDQSEALAFGGTIFYDFDGEVLVLDPTTGEIVGDADEPALEVVVLNEPLGFSEDWFILRKNEITFAVDRATGEVLWEEYIPNANIQISSSGRYVVGHNVYGEMVIVDTETWERVVVPGDFGNVRGLSFNSDESQVAIGSSDRLFIIDVPDRSVSAILEIPGVSDAFWLEDDAVLIGTNTGIWGTVSLDFEAFLAATRQGLRRAFTDEECSTYGIDPCPTLGELRRG